MAKSKVTKTLIRDLALLLDETNISEIEIEEEGLRIRVARNSGGGTYVQAPVVQESAPVPVAAPSVAEAPAVKDTNKNAVKSPMVGTAYLSPEPGADQFVKVGDKVKAGQTLLIVEAMKVMNPITAPSSGSVVEIIVADAEPVEFDQPLIVIE